jgi:hypothetical protein
MDWPESGKSYPLAIQYPKHHRKLVVLKKRERNREVRGYLNALFFKLIKRDLDLKKIENTALGYRN